jgi:hypothetical protein
MIEERAKIEIKLREEKIRQAELEGKKIVDRA